MKIRKVVPKIPLLTMLLMLIRPLILLLTQKKRTKENRFTMLPITVQQGQYIKMFKEQGMDAVILNHNIDTSFISQLEQRNEKFKFMRIDADLTDSLKEENAEDAKEAEKTPVQSIQRFFKE